MVDEVSVNTPDGVMDTDVIDVPLDVLEEELGGGGGSAQDNTGLPELDVNQPTVEPTRNKRRNDPMSMNELQLLNHVMRRGSLMFNDGQMLTKCPGYSDPAICGMYPLPHPATGDPIMVCAGPSICKTTKRGFFTQDETVYESRKPNSSCPYHPDRINDPPEYQSNDSSTGGEGWL